MGGWLILVLIAGMQVRRVGSSDAFGWKGLDTVWSGSSFLCNQGSLKLHSVGNLLPVMLILHLVKTIFPDSTTCF
jgi:hypothetical protein